MSANHPAVQDDLEDDIGLMSMRSPPTSIENDRPRISLVSSPSSPSTTVALSPRSPMSPVSRSRTLPRLRQSSTRAPSIQNLFSEPSKASAMQTWILGLAVVNFDLELGPVVDTVYPNLWLSSKEAENIAFSSFPDSLQFDQGSETHSFRIRALSPTDVDPPEARLRPPSDDGFIYGFSHFTQEKDTSSKRGYLQRSLVILTYLPYPALFSALVSKLGPLYHAHGSPMLEAACHNIASWPAPLPGGNLELGFLGAVYQARLPHAIDELQPPSLPPIGEDMIPINVSLPPPEPPILDLLGPSLSHLWSLWECLVLCEPVLVFGSSPAHTSLAIWWLRDLLRPLPLAIDFRPYFTIHDGDHAAITAGGRTPPRGVLLGVTNPFFARACAHWPHVLSLGLHKAAPTGTKANSKDAPGPKPGWATKSHKRYISKDRVLLTRLEAALRAPAGSVTRTQASSALREHFSARTTALLAPLNRYLNTLLPAHSSSSSLNLVAPTAPPPRLASFSIPAFLSSLRVHGVGGLPFKSTGKAHDFYERWVRTPAFARWLAAQEEVVTDMLRTG